MMFKEQKQIIFNQPGTRIVGQTEPSKFIDLWRKWNGLPNWALASGSIDAEVGLAVANEFIDWPYFRESGEYRPKDQVLTR